MNICLSRSKSNSKNRIQVFSVFSCFSTYFITFLSMVCKVSISVNKLYASASANKCFYLHTYILEFIKQNFHYIRPLAVRAEIIHGPQMIKLNYREKVFYFALNFLPWDFLSIKKLDFKKT